MRINELGKVEKDKKENVNVWFCEGCKSFHIKTGKILLTFDKKEFSEFVDETWNCFYEQQESFPAFQ